MLNEKGHHQDDGISLWASIATAATSNGVDYSTGLQSKNLSPFLLPDRGRLINFDIFPRAVGHIWKWRDGAMALARSPSASL